MNKEDQEKLKSLRAENRELKRRVKEFEESGQPFMDLLRTADEFGPAHPNTTALLADILEKAKS